MERREFLHLFGATLGAVLLARPLAAAAAARSREALALNAGEGEMLEAICARILPPVSGIATREAGCVNFIDKLLAHEEQALLPGYRAGLAALGAHVRAQWGAEFVALDAARQVQALEQLEDGLVASWPPAAPAQGAFFGTLRLHTLLGFLAAPAFGGNREGRGWKAVGYHGHLHGAGGISDEQLSRGR